MGNDNKNKIPFTLLHDITKWGCQTDRFCVMGVRLAVTLSAAQEAQESACLIPTF